MCSSDLLRKALVVPTVNDEKAIHTRVYLDSCATSASYAGEALVEACSWLKPEPCHHQVTLGDGQTTMTCTTRVTLHLKLEDPRGCTTKTLPLQVFVIPKGGVDIVVGLPDILGDFYETFMDVMCDARQRAVQNPTIVKNVETVAGYRHIQFLFR